MPLPPWWICSKGTKGLIFWLEASQPSTDKIIPKGPHVEQTLLLKSKLELFCLEDEWFLSFKALHFSTVGVHLPFKKNRNTFTAFIENGSILPIIFSKCWVDFTGFIKPWFCWIAYPYKIFGWTKWESRFQANYDRTNWLKITEISLKEIPSELIQWNTDFTRKLRKSTVIIEFY
jgi:hypothetical protein